jgi:hypothetical protein
MLVREIQISCLLASAFTFSILNYADDTALARPMHQGTEKNQSTGKPAGRRSKANSYGSSDRH